MDEQIVYYDAPNLLVTSGILVIYKTRISISSVRSITPTQTVRGKEKTLAALFWFLLGLGVLAIASMLMEQPEPLPTKWFPGVLIMPLCVPFLYLAWRMFKGIPKPLPAVSISVSEDEIYNVTFNDTNARESFCNALTRAMAERRVT